MIDYTLLEKLHPYIYGCRAFLSGTIETNQAAMYICADKTFHIEPDNALMTVEVLWTGVRDDLEAFGIDPWESPWGHIVGAILDVQADRKQGEEYDQTTPKGA